MITDETTDEETAMPHPTQLSAKAPAVSRRRAFSLLELIIVISIIALLMTIGFIGYGSIRRSQDLRNTKATMEVARSMYNAFIASAQSGGNNVASDQAGLSTLTYFKLAPNQWYFNTVAYGSTPTKIDHDDLITSDPAYARTIDYFNVPLRDPANATGTPVPMDVPIGKIVSVNDSSDDATLAADWAPINTDSTYKARWQLRNTMLITRRIRNAPEAKTLWSTLRDAQIHHVTTGGANQDFILDAWGRPILFVPGSGLRGVVYGDSGSGDYVKSGGVAGGVADQGLRSPDGRAYWVSAGPDGSFETQDDNVYSFNN